MNKPVGLIGLMCLIADQIPLGLTHAKKKDLGYTLTKNKLTGPIE